MVFRQTGDASKPLFESDCILGSILLLIKIYDSAAVTNYVFFIRVSNFKYRPNAFGLHCRPTQQITATMRERLRHLSKPVHKFNTDNTFQCINNNIY